MADKLLARAEAAAAHRAVKAWLNGCEALPEGLAVSFEDLAEKEMGLCFSTDQSPVYAARYITGGYKAQYQMQIIYRVLPSDDGDMLDAVELLTDISAWCAENENSLSIPGAASVRVERTSDAAVLGVYEDGTSDYGCGITITWEVF